MELSDKVKLIENLELDIGDKKNLILHAAGLKPNCMLDIRYCSQEYFDKDTETFYLDPRIYTAISNMIKFMEMKQDRGRLKIERWPTRKEPYSELKNPAIQISRLCVGPEAKQINELLGKEAFEPKDNIDFGLMLGYPMTAVRAFAYDKSKLVDWSLFDRCYNGCKDRSLDIIRFMSFKPTKSNLEQEMETVKEWHDCIKKLSPKLYNKIITWHENMQEGMPPTEEKKKFLYTSID